MDLSQLDFEDFALADTELDFYGVCADCFKIDDMIFEAEKDAEDGLRSYLKTIRLSPREEQSLTFFRRPIARVQVRLCDFNKSTPYEDRFRGYALVDLHDGHVWLRVGTDYSDSIYPYFVFRYQMSTGLGQLLGLEGETARESAVSSYLDEIDRLHK